MKTKYLLTTLLSLAFLGSCSKESAFEVIQEDGIGRFSKEAITFDVRDGAEDPIQVVSRAGELDDFKILFFRNNSVAPEASYMYGEMPDVVVLPVGTYIVTATKGADVEADWESPYFIGNSGQFAISKDEIASDIDPIVCKLQNVKVTVEFGPMLSGNMSEDSYVEVKVGDNAGLQFTKEHEGIAGHFRHTEGVSLVATFHGTVEDIPTVETKSYESVQKGHHYKLKFTLHPQNGDHYGEVDANVMVDASVTTIDLENNIVIDDEVDLGDEERPTEDGGETPPVTQDPPTIVGVAPIDIDQVNEITDDMSCVLNITSTAAGGFTKFVCDIVSDKLTADELENVHLSSHLDLVDTPDALMEPLTTLGFPTKVGGRNKVEFNLTNFMPMLGALGECEHHFVLTVGDANGETVKTLKLKQN